jgi:hypothetical protein
MEIEGSENEIVRVEKLLGIDELVGEGETYPRLALKYGKQKGDRIESRFKPAKQPRKR